MASNREPSNLLARLARAGHDRPWAALGLSGVVTALALVGAARLGVDSDLLTLLPESFPSVQAIHRVEEQLGGLGWIIVVGEGGEPEQLRRFADDVSAKLGTLPDVEFVDGHRSTAFFEERALYYLPLPELEKVVGQIEERLAYEKRARNPMYVDFSDDGPPEVDVAGARAAFEGGALARLATGGDRTHYLDAAGKFVAVLAKPAHTSSDLVFSKKLDAEVRKAVESLPISSYGPNFHWELTGAFRKKLEQTAVISKDVGVVSWIALVLVIAIALAHFRSFVGAALALAPVSIGLVWTYGLAGAAFGTVSLLTACLGAILGGLGVEHGVHFVSHYSSLRDEGKSSGEAVSDTFGATGRAALASALVATAAFGALAVSEFRAFREFGLLAAIGIIVVFAAFVAVLPATLGLAARRGWVPPHGAVTRRSGLLAWVGRRAGLVSIGAAAALLVTFVVAPKVRFIADFATLEDTSLRAYELDRRVNALLGFAQNPAIVATDNVADERKVADALRHGVKNPDQPTMIDFVATLGDLVPDQQAEKRVVLDGLAAKVRALPPAMLKDLAPQVDWQKMLDAKPFTRQELPDSIRRWFGRHDGGAVLVFSHARSNDGGQIRRFADELRDGLAPLGKQFHAAGEALVLADILSLVLHDSPRVGLLVVIAVFGILAWALGSFSTAFTGLLPTLVSLAALAGLLPMAGLSLDFLNVIVVPVLVGTTVDAGVHLALRAGTDEPDELYGSIAGGLLTNGVGFGALLVAGHPGLQSIGRLASLGFAVNALVVLVAVPAAMAVWKRLFPRPVSEVIPSLDETGEEQEA